MPQLWLRPRRRPGARKMSGMLASQGIFPAHGGKLLIGSKGTKEIHRRISAPQQPVKLLPWIEQHQSESAAKSLSHNLVLAASWNNQNKLACQATQHSKNRRITLAVLLLFGTTPPHRCIDSQCAFKFFFTKTLHQHKSSSWQKAHLPQICSPAHVFFRCNVFLE